MIDIIIKYVNQPVSMTIVVCVLFVVQQGKITDLIRRVTFLESRCDKRQNWCLQFFKKDNHGGK
jgi:hypothetical protein